MEEKESEANSSAQHTYHPLELKLYMERSGSMVSFDTERSSGEFKGIVSTLLNRFPTVESRDSTAVYIVNDNIYPFKGSVRDFLAQRDFFTATKGIGDPSFTDFDRIFSMIMSDVTKYQVSALISDLIYSSKGQENVSASKLLNEAYALTHNTFKNKTNTSVIILKFEAGYSGPYYNYASPSKGVTYNGERPFYVMLFLSKESLQELYEAPEYEAFIKFSTLNNFEDMFCFTDLRFRPAFSIIPEIDHEGRFRKERTHGNSLITGICDAQLSKDGGISIPIAVDLSGIPLSESYKKNKSLYDVESSTGFKIASIRSLANDADCADKVKDRLSGATHLIILESDEKPKNETVKISLAYRLPSWIAESSTDDDTDISKEEFDSTTFGLESMMKGIFAAYVPDGSRCSILDLEFTVKKK
ncbi:MAG: hypothetical protein K2H46_00315 [Muribaculaceae bacterium]|nr:hypothetical protein [Muribaculaceae bacterium]